MAVAGPESGALQTNPESKITGLLPHERTFVEGAMRLAARKRSEAQAAIGEANLNSGGDWAFDDLTTRAAAEEAVLTDATYQKLKDLHDQGMKNPIDYPAEDDAVVRPGTRVTYKTPRWEETVDVASVRIPGMPEDEDNGVEVVSSESALGAALLGLTLGSQFTWATDGTRKFEGVVTGVDQASQREFYNRIFRHHSA